MQRKTQTFGLGFDQVPSDRMHGDAVSVTVERDEQADDLDDGVVAGGVEGEGAVLTATPTHPRLGSLLGLRREPHST